MRLVKIEKTSTGFALDPNAYLDKLPDLRAQLPPGAWAFASDPEHYDHHSERCVKDLKLVALAADVDGDADDGALRVRFAFNDVAPEQLTIRYEDASSVLIHSDADARMKAYGAERKGLMHRLGPVQLDEVMPHPDGCEHEIKLIGGTIRIVCADLVASWISRPAAESAP